MKPNRLSQVSLGQILVRRKDGVHVEDFKTYKRVTIRTKGQGIVIRDELPGTQIRTKKQFLIHSGQLLLSKIDARNGAFGVVPEECDEAIITGNFWTFDVDTSRLDVRYLNYMTKMPSFVEFCIRSSEGTTNRRYLREHLFLNQKVPLPPLEEQRRIVARIEALAGKVDKARRLREEAIKEVQHLYRSIVLYANDWAPTPTPMSELVTWHKPNIVVEPNKVYDFAGVYSFGRGVFRNKRKYGSEFKYGKLTRLKATEPCICF